MDITPNSSNSLISTTTPVFGDNVQDLLNAGLLNLKPTGIIVVNSSDDVLGFPGATTLRDAILQANADSGEDLIVFERSLFSNAQTITLNLGELDITHSLDIIAPTDELTGTDLVTVSGNKASRVFEIEKEATVNLSGLIIADGSVTGEFGGGIKNSGILSLESSIVRNNFANPFKSSSNLLIGGFGGGIYSSGTTTVNNSTISGNSAGGSGGGISGGGTVTNSTISGNSAGGSGGGISGGGTVTNSTISGNSASQNGGGIYNDYSSTLTLLFSTVTQNQAANGGGVYQNDVPPSSTSRQGAFNVRNTIIAANLNSANGVNPDVSGTFTSNGYNLIGDGTGSTGFGEATWDIVGTSDWVIDPRLAPLDFYGGPTQTIALLPDSPAIGAADPTVLDTDPTTDQRSLPRRAADGSADIGAFQFS